MDTDNNAIAIVSDSPTLLHGGHSRDPHKVIYDFLPSQPLALMNSVNPTSRAADNRDPPTL